MFVNAFLKEQFDGVPLRYVLIKGIPWFAYPDAISFIGSKYTLLTITLQKLGINKDTVCISVNSPNLKASGLNVIEPTALFKIINVVKHLDKKRVQMLIDYYQKNYGVVLTLEKKIGHCRNCNKLLSDEDIRIGKLYCSKECKLAWEKQAAKEYRQALYLLKIADRPAYKICPNCGKQFDYHSIQQVYCSKKCKSIAQQSRSAERKSHAHEPFYNPRAVYSNADLDSCNLTADESEEVNNYLRRLHAWEWGLVYDDLKTWK